MRGHGRRRGSGASPAGSSCPTFRERRRDGEHEHCPVMLAAWIGSLIPASPVRHQPFGGSAAAIGARPRTRVSAEGRLPPAPCRAISRAGARPQGDIMARFEGTETYVATDDLRVAVN